MTTEQIKLMKQLEAIRIKANNNPANYPQDYLARLMECFVFQFFDPSLDRHKFDELMNS